jgi:RNA polymerase sigma-B factor
LRNAARLRLREKEARGSSRLVAFPFSTFLSISQYFPMTRTLPSTPATPRTLRQRNQLVEAHRDLVRPLALHYARRCPEPQEDLQQAGMLGLIRAAELYCPEQGTPFAAFARPHIRGAILHHLRDVAPRVRLPRRQAERLERILREEARGAGSTCGPRAPLPWEERAVLLRQRELSRPLPLEGTLLDDLPAQEPEEGEPTALDPGQSAQRVRALLEQLEPRQRRVVSQVVLAGGSYRHLAQELGISPMTVKRLLQQGLDNLRRSLEQRGVTGADWSRPAPSAAPGC